MPSTKALHQDHVTEVWYKGSWPRRWPDPVDGPWLLDCRIEMTRLGARLTALTIRPATTWPPPNVAARVTHSLLRDIPVRELVQEWARQRQDDLAAEYPVESKLVGKVARRERPATSGRRKKLAAAYWKARDDGDPTGPAVAEALHVTVGNARVLILRARKGGYLGPARPSSAG